MFSALAFSFVAAAAAASAQDDTSFFVHLALSSDPTRMFVSWRTNSSSAPASVAYGASPTALTQLATGQSWTFTDSTSREYYLHRATLTGLAPGARVFYRAGGAASAVSSFVATRAREQFSAAAPLRIAWLGDLGYTNGQALDYLLKEAAVGTFDHYVHVGDYAYDLNSANGAIGDLFEGGIEPITRSAPYQGAEGNHEGANGFAHYSNRFAVFSMDNSSAAAGVPGLYPTAWNSHWYSYDVGLVHFVVLSTETYFSYPAGVAVQYAWADADLAAVDRAKTPWVVVYGHRSVYCSCDTDCDAAATTVRLGPKGDGALGVEALFKKHRVDLWVNGHEHECVCWWLRTRAPPPPPPPTALPPPPPPPQL